MVLLAALLGVPSFVPAHTMAAASMAPSTVASPNGSSSLEHLDTNKTARSNTLLTPRRNPASSPMIPSAYRGIDQITPSPAIDPAASQTSTWADSGWRFTAALLGTVAIIGTIAVRRRKPGKPWV